MLGFQAIQLVNLFERLLNKQSRQLVQTCHLEATVSCSLPHCLVELCGSDLAGYSWMGARDLNVPKYLYRVRFLTRCTSGRPNLNVTCFTLSARGNVGQDARAQSLEDTLLR